MNAPTPQASVLVVDDEPDLRSLYELTLLREGYRVETAADLRSARESLRESRFDALITDMRLPDGMGLELVRQIAQERRAERSIVITAYGSAENAVEALKCGAFDYLTKPVDLQQFRHAVASALGRGTAAQAATALAPRVAGQAPALRHAVDGSVTAGQAPLPAPAASAIAAALSRITGESAIMKQVRQRVAKVASSMAPILVRGESGTGKELVARALHDCSHRADGPFVAVNCGAIPETLIEAEFFGVRKGAYTGATQDREGYFQAARGGTIFLDEIGDLPLAMQAKLLRAIQERQIRPLGSAQEERIDVRFVSATHRDLAQDVREGRFRQDLFYRLNVIEIWIPPLRERREDMPDLVRALLERLCRDSGQLPVGITDEAVGWLQTQRLAGNVRELENLLHRGLALNVSGTIEVEDLDEPPSGFGELTDRRGRPQAAASLDPVAAEPAAAASTPAASSWPVAWAPLHSAQAPPGSAGSALKSTRGRKRKETVPPSAAARELAVFLDRQEGQVLREALEASGQDLNRAASALGLSADQLQFRLHRLGLWPPSGPIVPGEATPGSAHGR